MARIVFFWAIWVALATVLVAAPTVEMEIVAEPGLNTAAAAQKWTKVLGEMGVAAVRFRSPQPDDRVRVQTERSGTSVTYRITGRLSGRGGLVMPGGEFGLSDGQRLRQWLEQLRSGGPDEAGWPPGPFGLTRKQFDELTGTLAMPVGFPTKGMPPRKAIEQIVGALKLPLAVEPAVDRAIEADEPVRDELQGVSSGTALAAIARPAGGALVPRMTGDVVELTIVGPPKSGDSWSIGWPSKENDDGKLIPALFEFLNVEIDGVSAAEAIDAIQGRLKAPLLMDHNNMARHRIDLTRPVSIPAGRTYYRRMLDRVLFQVGLKFEVRVDEAGKPLLWVATLKP